MTPILLDWQMSTISGWGILGLNVFSHWASDSRIEPYMGEFIRDTDVPGIDPLRLQRILPAMSRSNRHLESLLQAGNNRLGKGFVTIKGLGNGFERTSPRRGDLDVGRCVFEDTAIGARVSQLAQYDCLLTGSNWNAAMLEAHCGRKAAVILEGVDTSLFSPGPRSGLFPADLFYIFSGGKAEFRKGQDLVLKVFREFSAKYRDAVLVVAWRSLWPEISLGMKGVLDVELKAKPDGTPDIVRWCVDNGIDGWRVVDLDFMPNSMMPTVLREMDVALQLSRAEACTNLPAKEAMACGVPVIATANTGMLDLLCEENSIPLRALRPVTYAGWGTEGWGECQVDEAYAALERAYRDRTWLKSVGENAARWIINNNRTWRHHAAQLKQFILDNA